MPKLDEETKAKRLTVEDTTLLASIKAVIAAIALVASFEAGVSILIPDGGWAKVIAPLISATGLLIASLYIIRAKKERSIEIALASSQPSRLVEYRYNRSFRVFCMAGAAALSIIIFIRLWQILPNAFTGKTYVSGFVCSAKTGEPIMQGTVEILGYGDIVISHAPQKLDDRGFFYSELKQWTVSPITLQIVGTNCGETYRIPLKAISSGACPTRTLAPSTQIVTKEWVISCDTK